MTQTANYIIGTKHNLRHTKWGIYVFFSRKQDKECFDCGDKKRKLKRIVGRLAVDDRPCVVISYKCRRCP
jgi:hypothetical protein